MERSGAGRTGSSDVVARSNMGRTLSFLREYVGVTQRALSEGSGIAKSTISDLERGERDITESTKRRLLVALGVPVRAWEETVRHMEWLDWLVGRYRGDGWTRDSWLRESGPSLGGSGTETEGAAHREDPDAMRREVERLAALIGRDKERHVAAVLGLLVRL